MEDGPRVCVIGAGPGGLCAVRYCLEYDVSVVCYEQRPRLGGVWTSCADGFGRSDPRGRAYTVVRDGLLLNTSQFVATFADFPLPPDLTPSGGRRYLSGPEFLDYMDRYADAFDLRAHVRLSTEVVRVRRRSGRRHEERPWAVAVCRRLGDKVVEEESFHQFVIVASGFFRQPHVATIPGMEDSPVEWIHSAHVHNTVQTFIGKRVLVVGASISAADMAQAAVEAGASKVTWAVVRNSDTRSICISPRYPFMQRLAWDECFSLFGSLYYPEFLARYLLCKIGFFIHRRHGNAPLDFTYDRVLVQDTDVLEAAVRDGRLAIVKTTIARLCAQPGRVEMADGTGLDVDLCVLATGYDSSFPFLDAAVLGDGGPRDLLMHRSIVATNPSAWGLSFLYTTPVVGSGIGSNEMEARWIVHEIATGRLATEEQRLALVAQRPHNQFVFREKTRRICTDIAHALALDLGCQPRLWSALFSPSPWQRRVGLAAAVGPWLPQHYRLRGPHANPEMAGATIVKVARLLMGWKFEALALAVDLLHVLGAVSALTFVGRRCRLLLLR